MLHRNYSDTSGSSSECEIIFSGPGCQQNSGALSGVKYIFFVRASKKNSNVPNNVHM